MKFCGSCGAGVRAQCNFCGSENPAGIRFCGECGKEVATSAAGIAVYRALEWRAMFEEMGWAQSVPTRFQPTFVELLTSNEISLPDADDSEPWLFCTHVANRDWAIADFKIDGQRVEAASESGRRKAKRVFMVGAGLLTYGVGAVVVAKAVKRGDQVWVFATRQRLAVANLNDKQLIQWEFPDIVDGTARPNGDFTLQSNAGETIGFKVKTTSTAKARAWANVGSIMGSHSVDYYRQRNSIDRVEGTKQDFMSIVGQFVSEIVGV